jgi:hypothetical protein
MLSVAGYVGASGVKKRKWRRKRRKKMTAAAWREMKAEK